MNTPGQLFLSHSLWKLQQMQAAIEARLPLFSPGQIWAKSKPTENSVGNLILHLCGNVRYYIGHGIDVQPHSCPN